MPEKRVRDLKVGDRYHHSYNPQEQFEVIDTTAWDGDTDKITSKKIAGSWGISNHYHSNKGNIVVVDSESYETEPETAQKLGYHYISREFLSGSDGDCTSKAVKWMNSQDDEGYEIVEVNFNQNLEKAVVIMRKAS